MHLSSKTIMKRLLLITCIIVGFNSARTNAQINFVKDVSNKGTTAAAFLEIGVNARAEAMGGAYTAQRGYVDMIYWNPAGLAPINNVSVTFSNTEWLANTTFNFASVAIPIPTVKSVIGASFTTLGVPEQSVRDYDGSLTGEKYDARDFAVNFALSTHLIPKFSFGVTAKYIYQRIWSGKAIGMGFDFGVQYETPLKGLVMGSSISNFGGDMSMSGKNLKEVIDPDKNNEGVNNIPVEYVTDEYPLPQIFRFGIAYDIDFNDYSLNTSVDLLHPSSSTESINLGGEFGYKKLIFIRGGYQNLFERDQINGLTMGVGIQYMLNNRERFVFDYALSDWGVLGKAHRISVSIYL